jgi:plastocyanin
MSNVAKTAGIAFVGVFVLVVAVFGVAGFVVSDDTTSGTTAAPEHVELENPQYSADRVSANSTPGQANIDMENPAVNRKIVVHAGSNIAERDISPLVNELIEQGHEVDVLIENRDLFGGGPILFGQSQVSQIGPPPSSGDNEPVLDDRLEDAHAFISIGVNNYVQEDLEQITEFTEDNGRVVMAVDPNQEYGFGTGQSSAYGRLGVFTEPGYIYNLEENDLNYQRIFVEPEGGSMLTDGVDRAVFDSATPVGAASVDATFRPIEGSQLSTSRAQTDKPLLVRNGNVAIIGDTHFMAPENTQRADNDVLVANVGEYLVGSNRQLGDSSNGDSGGSTETVTVEVGPGGEPVFEPNEIEIDPGDTVRFVWKSGGYNIVPVNQQPADSPWDGITETKQEGFIHEFTFEQEGVHEFVSEPQEDQGMFGVIIVGDPQGSGSGSESR